jgi:predicted RNA-binding Zn-ribbon protein involved in translation (DUF1610 family)
MAIKRPSKSMGTPLRKPVAAALHVDLRAKQQMVPGDRYLGWLCKNRACGVLIAIAPAAAGKAATQKVEDQLTALKCPHCGYEDLYRWSARSEHEYTPKSLAT